MKRIQRVDLIDGPILPTLLSFAFPILLSNIFQQLYNTSDVMIVGRFLGQKSLAAVGATSAIFDLIVGFAVGVGMGWASLSREIMELKTMTNYENLSRQLLLLAASSVSS